MDVGRFVLSFLVIASFARAQDSLSSSNEEGTERTSNVQLRNESEALSLRDFGLKTLAFAQIAQNKEPVQPPRQPSQFNPDPGAPNEPESIEPPSLFPPVIPPLPKYGEEPLPRSLELPRKGVREVVPRRSKLEYENYPEAERNQGFAQTSA